MKQHKYRFLRKSALFLIIIAVLLYFLNQAWISIEDEQRIFRHEEQWQAYLEELDDKHLDYAFFGDSHAANAVMTFMINDSFNFANPGEDYTETYYRARKLFDLDEVIVDTIVLEVDIHTFSDELRTKERLFRAPRYWYDFVPYATASELKQTTQLNLIISTNIRFQGKGTNMIRELVKPSKHTPLKRGWNNFTESLTDKDMKAVAQDVYDEIIGKDIMLLEQRSFEHFLSLVKLADKRGIDIIIIMYPHSQEFHEILEENNISREQHYDIVFNYMDQYVDEYEVLDYHDIFFEHPEYFADADHLNYRGAEAFTTILIDDLASNRRK